MVCSNRPPFSGPLVFFLTATAYMHLSLAPNPELTEIKGRALMSIKETLDGGNVTFDCSPSGPCIPCSRSVKSDEKYHCGETGYHIRLKCVPSGSDLKDEQSLKAQKMRSTLEIMDSDVNQHDAKFTTSSTSQRRLLAHSSKPKGGSSSYISYRSCIPAVNEEKLSVFGFEALMLALLLSSGSFIYFRRKRSSAVAGGVPVRLPTNSKF